MKHARRHAACILLALAAASLPACAPPPPGAATVEQGSEGPVDVSPEGRRALVRLPRGYRPDTRYPLLVVLHGYASNGREAAAYLGLDAAVEDEPLVLALPEGAPDATGRPSWNADPMCCRGGATDDVAYLVALVDRLVARYSIDPRRVFAAGQSNGGFMAHRLACAAAPRFAAVASLSGALFASVGACEPASPVAVLEVHGVDDLSVPYQGGWLHRRDDPTPYLGAESTMAVWASLNGCAKPPREGPSSLDLAEGALVLDTRITRYEKCAPGGAAELWTLGGGGHIPRYGPGLRTALLSFFRDHVRR